MSFKFGVRSRMRLSGVHPDLVRVMEAAIKITDIDFAVIEGVRTVDRQRELVAKGASTTMDGRHITGHAVDVAAMIGNQVRWDWPLYAKIAVAVKQAAKDLNIPIIWGGDWKSFPDGPHFELDRKRYP